MICNGSLLADIAELVLWMFALHFAALAISNILNWAERKISGVGKDEPSADDFTLSN